jgi:dTDP-4-dehydrorhamnose 3,5-epimerase-like enzyme
VWYLTINGFAPIRAKKVTRRSSNDTAPSDAHLVELERRGDERRSFARLRCEREFANAGLESRFVQIDNSLSSTKGTLRGLHYPLRSAAEVAFAKMSGR